MINISIWVHLEDGEPTGEQNVRIDLATDDDDPGMYVLLDPDQAREIAACLTIRANMIDPVS